MLATQVLRVQKRGISSLGTPKVVPTLSDDEDAPPPMPVDEDDEDGLNEFLPSDVDPGAQSDASNASAPEKVEVKPTKPVVKKPTKKPKGKKMTRAKWQAAKQKALESKEKKEQKAAEKVVAKLQKSKLSGLASVLTKPQSSSDTDDDGRHTARVGGDSGSDSDPSADDDPESTNALQLEVTRRRAALAAATVKGEEDKKGLKALKRAARAARLAAKATEKRDKRRQQKRKVRGAASPFSRRPDAVDATLLHAGPREGRGRGRRPEGREGREVAQEEARRPEESNRGAGAAEAAVARESAR